MFVRAYLRASTREQDASRARDALEQFAADHGQRIACEYLENESGAKADRPELLRLLKDYRKGDMLLTESVDRLSRLPAEDWIRFASACRDRRLSAISSQSEVPKLDVPKQ